MEDKKKQLENSFKEGFDHYHSDRKEQFEEFYRKFLKTAGKEELVLFYEVYQGTFDHRYIGADSWRTLYDYVWRLIPACQKEKAAERQDAIIRALRDILVKNIQLVKKGLLKEKEKYLVLDLVLDILFAGWFKNSIGFPAVLYNVMLDEQNEDFAEFYGKEAQIHIADHVMLKLSDTEKKSITERETAQDFQKDFEIVLKGRIREEKEERKRRADCIQRQRMGNQPTEQLKENVGQKETKGAVSCKEQISGDEYNEKKGLIFVIHEKKKYFIGASALFLLGLLVMFMAVSISRNKYAKENENLKEKVESLETENDELKEKRAEDKKLISQLEEEKKDKQEDNTSEEKEKSTTTDKNEDGSISVKAEDSSSKEEGKDSENKSKLPMEYTLQSNHNLREEPTASSQKLASIKEGTTVKVMREAGENWYEVELEDGKTGYLHIEVLEK